MNEFEYAIMESTILDDTVPLSAYQMEVYCLAMLPRLKSDVTRLHKRLWQRIVHSLQVRGEYTRAFMRAMAGVQW